MGTRSSIAYEDPETGIVTSSYCHYDGYLEGVGQTLVENYASPIQAREVASGGYYSALSQTVELSLADAVNKDEPQTFANAAAYFEDAKEAWTEYLYLYRQGVWFYAEPGGAAGPFLVRADDPNAEGEEIWRNVAGVLGLGPEKPRSYALG
ncbi:hypothetical protein [Croceicoccus naphthovorans]|uniref:hypothetical protein n=1 Tax=Croceicoccus naphthovorans TaxID=1348774 RepID=UPI00069DE853|nr:hypothetical protein [Croceicoccus naphthovorans]MBB3990290.1 hypothetical protein [Croceicoccus naphthovorans]